MREALSQRKAALLPHNGLHGMLRVCIWVAQKAGHGRGSVIAQGLGRTEGCQLVKICSQAEPVRK